jgi:type I restriction enzyme S subunit
MVTWNAGPNRDTQRRAINVGIIECYKRTEVGAIPEQWQVKQLGQMSQFITSGSRGWAKYYSDRGPLFVRSQNIRDGRLDFTDRQCVIPPAGSEGRRTRLNCNDLLITITGNSVGNVAWVERDLGEAYISQHVGLARLLEPSFAEYVCLFLAPGSPGNRQIWASQTGQSKPGLNLRNLENFWVALPSPPEQRAIVTALRHADALIDSLEQLIAKKRSVKQGTVQELFRPNSDHQSRPLCEVSSLKGRIGWQGLKQTEFTTNEDDPFLITGMNFKDGAIHWHEVYHVSEARYQMAPEIQLRQDDVLMTKDGTIGKLLYVDEIPHPRKASLNSHLLLFRPIKESYIPKYLYYQLDSQRFRDFIELRKSGTTFFGISQKAVGEFSIVLPSFEQQQNIVAILSDMDTEISALEARLTKARQIKQGMMQQLLTGRIRLL